jgi:hypothetical protein
MSPWRSIDFTRLFSQLVLNVGVCVQWVAFVFPTGGPAGGAPTITHEHFELAGRRAELFGDDALTAARSGGAAAPIKQTKGSKHNHGRRIARSSLGGPKRNVEIGYRVEPAEEEL